MGPAQIVPTIHTDLVIFGHPNAPAGRYHGSNYPARIFERDNDGGFHEGVPHRLVTGSASSPSHKTGTCSPASSTTQTSFTSLTTVSYFT